MAVAFGLAQPPCVAGLTRPASGISSRFEYINLSRLIFLGDMFQGVSTVRPGNGEIIGMDTKVEPPFYRINHVFSREKEY